MTDKQTDEALENLFVEETGLRRLGVVTTLQHLKHCKSLLRRLPFNLIDIVTKGNPSYER